MSEEIPFLDLRAAHDEAGAEIEAALLRVARSGRYVLGEEVEAFEAEFAAFCGAAFCVGTGNGLDALTLSLRAIGIGAGDEVLAPSNTYVATWLAVSAAGATPVPVEPDPATRNIDPARIEAAITPSTRAILAVHLYGLPADMDAILAIARRHGLKVVEDAAQAHGARLNGRRIGAHGDAICWSFYPTKNLGALGDAGAVTTDDPGIAERLRRLRNYGGASTGEMTERGANSRLDPLQAAVLRVKLRRLESWNARRGVHAARYLEALAGAGLDLPTAPEGYLSAWHLFVVHVAERDALRRRLAACGIGTMIHYPVPPHMQPAYADLGLAPDALPLARRLAAQALSLPLSPHLTEADRERIIDVLRAAPPQA